MSSQKCEKAVVKTIGKVAIIRTERGSKALVGIETLCNLAKKLNLCLENYNCI
ncbi:hypothetical protein QPL79_01420 [Ignisphaera sp. 4213-co]|uniref:Uncharacterized protein n=1 Tax=Ignisphaera cupida TaxID=3050454 RepID=A0ABD4Z4E9_9CREN|nr:hypothetical protein [Ignisphaera sp. 4213-co]MDK6028025.1 hypothetical protein [Ignisphaera sp. 4213-co]